MNNLVDLQPRIVEKMIDDNVVMIDVRRVDEWGNDDYYCWFCP